MSELTRIFSNNRSPVILPAGEYFAVTPLIVASHRKTLVTLEEGAKLYLTAFVTALEQAPSLALTVDLIGRGAEFHLNALYIASGEGRAHIDTQINHFAPDCVSRQLIKGIAAGSATASFTGLVHVARNAQKTDASQRNQNLQLTDTAHIHTNPGLEIYADDVKCSHGATIGRLDEEAIYYMRQRGIGEALARRMQLHGFADEIVNYCPSEELRQSVAFRIGKIIDRL
jgi:Fe-S cluster assembly protein SufD